MRRLLLLLVVVAAVLQTATACGVPLDESPRVLERDAAPFRVFDREVAPPPQGDLQAELWFVQGAQAVPVPRVVEVPGSPRQVLEQLLRGPTSAELAGGLSTAIPTSLTLADVTVRDDIAVVTLEGLTQQVQVEAYAQIVATLDGRPGIDGVRFRDGGGDVPVPRGDGVLGAGAVTREDYAVLLAPPPPPGPPPSPAG